MFCPLHLSPEICTYVVGEGGQVECKWLGRTQLSRVDLGVSLDVKDWHKKI